MASFAEKSQQSLEAAKMLFKSSLYPSTVNRAYYGFHQFMMHILFTKLGKTQEEFENDVNYYDQGTHTLTWNLVGPAFAKLNKNEFKWLQGKISELKKQRILADYKDYATNPEDATICINNAGAMINLLKITFK